MVSFVTSSHHLHILIFLPHFFTYDFPQFLIYFSANLCNIWHEENLGPHHESEINLAIDHRIPFKATKFQLSSFLLYMNYSKKTPAGDDFVPLARVKISHRTGILVLHGLLFTIKDEKMRQKSCKTARFYHLWMIKISWASNGGPVYTRKIYSDKLQNLVNIYPY